MKVRRTSSVNQALAGLCGHLFTGLVYPLDLIKVRTQVMESKIGQLALIKDIFNKEGIRGFFRGFYFNILSGGIANVIFFFSLDYYKRVLIKKEDNYNPKVQFCISYLAGVTAGILTLPIWTLRTRLSLITIDKQSSRKLLQRLSYSYLLIKESFAIEGFFHLYKGIFPCLILAFHGGILMTIYETLKNYFVKRDGKMTSSYGALFGIIGKLASITLLYPFHVIRSKQQQISTKYNFTIAKNSIVTTSPNGLFLYAMKTIYNANGFRGFYRGLLTSILMQIPSNSIFFFFYEKSLRHLNQFN